MKGLFILLSLVGLASCSSIKTLSNGKKYEVQCHQLTTSNESCAEEVAGMCPNGYVIEKSVFKYVLLKGPQRSVTVRCNEEI
jgi:hypothetical protein